MAGPGRKNRSYPGHLSVVGGGIDGDVCGLGKGGEAREAKESETDKANFAEGVRTDAYCDHNIYNHHKQRPCHD